MRQGSACGNVTALHDARAWLRDAEEAFGVGVDRGVELLPVNAAESCEFFRCETHHPGLAWRFAAVRMRAQKGGVGFDHDSISGREQRGFAQVLRGFVRHDARETDACAEIEEQPHLARAGGEAVEDETSWIERTAAENRDEVIEGFATMEDDWLDEAFAVERFDCGELFFEHLALHGCGGFFVVVVEA